MWEAERQVAMLARRQHGLVARWQALAAGVSRSAWQRLVRSGRLQLVHPGVGRLAGTPSHPHQHILAGALAVGPSGLASHGSAAVIWGVDLALWPVEVTTTHRGRGAHPAGVVVHHPTDLVDLAPVRRHGVPVTNPLRTLVDLGASHPDTAVEAALETLVVARLVTVGGARAVLGRHGRPGRSGAGALRRVLCDWALADSIPDSELEALVAQLLVRHGLPAAVHHLRVGRYELDFAWPAHRVAMEADGWSHHGSRAAFEADRWRDLELATMGWQVVRTTKRAILRGGRELAARLGAVLLERAS